MQFFINLNVHVASYDDLPVVIKQLEQLAGAPIAGLHFHGESNAPTMLAQAAASAPAPATKSKGKKDKAETPAAATPEASAPAAPSPSPSAPPPAAPASADADAAAFLESLKALRAEAARVIAAKPANRVAVHALVEKACGPDVTEPKLSGVPLTQHPELLAAIAALAPATQE